MNDKWKAGFLYFFVVFGVGFLMGPVREFLFLPHLGPTGAILAESPILIGAMILGGWWIISRYRLENTVPARLTMGGVGLGLVLIGDWFVGIFLRGWTTSQIIQHYGTLPGLINLFLFVIYLVVPIVMIFSKNNGNESS